jgi:arginyl-tRNA synthetase
MNLSEVWKTISHNPGIATGIVIVLMSFIEVSKIKINPWSAIGRLFGRFLGIKDVSDKVAVAALKYADLIPNVEKDYIFDLDKFCSLEGKTGPYILYSAVRMKSLLAKAGETGYVMHDIYSQTEKELITKVLEMPIRIDKAYRNKTLSEITEYIYELDSLFNKFYGENRILTEEDEAKKQTWLFLTDVVYKVNKLLLDVLAISIPDRM